MKIGDLVTLKKTDDEHRWGDEGFLPWRGIIISYTCDSPIVFWNERFAEEIEYSEQLRVINEAR